MITRESTRLETVRDCVCSTQDAYELQIKELEDQHRAEFRDLELQYDSKINSEVARYQGLVAARDAENRSWDQANLELTDSHTAEKKELQEAFDIKVEEEKRLQEAVRVETAAGEVSGRRTGALPSARA